MSAPVYLLKGNDPLLLDDAVRALVDELVGDADRNLAVEELDASSYGAGDGGEVDAGPIVNAAQTPPFLTDHRVVVARHAGAFSTADRVEPLVAYLDDPLPTTSLVLVWERAPTQKQLPQVPAKLKKAVAGADGREIDAGAPRKAADRRAYVTEQVAAAGIKLDKAAVDRIVEHLGEEVSRLGGLLETLVSTFGPKARLSVDDIEPYLGDQSDLAPWDLTDAIDRGDKALAIDRLRRMLAAGRHPMQLMYVLHGHYTNLLRLDGADVTSPAEAAELLGIRNGFPAKKALDLSRRLPPGRVQEAIVLLAEADLDLRGAKPVDYPVMEVLVARLANRCGVR